MRPKRRKATELLSRSRRGACVGKDALLGCFFSLTRYALKHLSSLRWRPGKILLPEWQVKYFVY